MEVTQMDRQTEDRHTERLTDSTDVTVLSVHQSVTYVLSVSLSVYLSSVCLSI